MAFFKFRKGGDATPATPAQAESVEVLRRRARHRLIGAAVLVLIGVIGFPLLFDTQPRPVAVDIPIEIPDRNKAKPLPMPATRASGPQAAVAAPASAPAVAKAEPQDASRPEAREPSKAEAARPAARPETVARSEPAAKAPASAPVAKTTSSAPAAPPVDASRAQSLLEGKPVQAEARDRPAAADGRFVVQVGAFADAVKARETRLKVEKSGLKTYTHVAETKDGKRIRVRVGPFATRSEADKAASKIKELDLPAAILTL
ncbi:MULTISPECIES: SPOR domain-containing protein [Ramlibacter]|uniref:SPOR domain-containing protein n=1 Tax=Ramlibacter pinisoli TaxID=2682844 RepID=A0A6N8IZ61_9BURK|nr:MULTISPECIES: SPOR domain-containing protein [Ramlibacter]MBA2962185.1 SPOR domain-containing protein [Ramlibacter sp. CGMCC 1.13660]MVQ32127.1 SPOR domain-containing protein [Ramlibacter pinisoli]